MRGRRVAIAAGLIAVLAGVAGWAFMTRENVVPDVRGLAFSEAREVLGAAGFGVPMRDEQECGSLEDRYPQSKVEVFHQSPSPGAVAQVRHGVDLQGGIRVGVSSIPCGRTSRSFPRSNAGAGLGFFFFCVVPLVLVFYSWADMKHRGEPGWLWAIFMFFLFPIALPVWLIVRGQKPRRPEFSTRDFSAWGGSDGL
ncbi:MAG: PASTA domain-containing protein [Actinomycetota bacterium]